jgi:hypothetical protein
MKTLYTSANAARAPASSLRFDEFAGESCSANGVSTDNKRHAPINSKILITVQKVFALKDTNYNFSDIVVVKAAFNSCESRVQFL